MRSGGSVRCIRTDDQVQLAELLLDVGREAASYKSAASLYSLSMVASLLLPYADESEVTLFFDLGEYLYECADDVAKGPLAQADGWREQALQRLLKSLRAAKLSRR